MKIAKIFTDFQVREDFTDFKDYKNYRDFMKFLKILLISKISSDFKDFEDFRDSNRLQRFWRFQGISRDFLEFEDFLDLWNLCNLWKSVFLWEISRISRISKILQDFKDSQDFIKIQVESTPDFRSVEPLDSTPPCSNAEVTSSYATIYIVGGYNYFNVLNPLRPKIRSQKLPSSVLYNSARFASFELKIGTRLFSRVLFKMPFFVFVLKSILTGNMHLKKKWCHFFVFFFENPNFDPRKVVVPS